MSVEPLRLGTDLADRLSGTPCLILLDVDGTLAPIVDRHDQAAVPPATQRAVATLVSRPGVHVALVSGRSVADARRMVGVERVWAVGNHGSETMTPDGNLEVDARVAEYQPAIAKVASTLEPLIAMVPGVVLENKTWTLSIHFRLADPGVVPRLRGAITELARRHSLRVMEGKMIFEVRPPVQVDKGTAVLGLADKLGGLADSASVLFIGDDTTDEDGFRVLRERLPNAVTVRVFDGDLATADTAAEFMIGGTEGVRRMLEWLAALRNQHRQPSPD